MKLRWCEKIFVKNLKKKFLIIKMEWEMYTVPRLKQMAKERGLRGHSKLRKPELLNLLNPPPMPRQNVPRLLDQNVPNINEPVLDTRFHMFLFLS